MGRMISTTQKLCKTCKYHYGGDNALMICNYLGVTGKRRNCEPGVCDKYELGKNERKEIIPWDDQ